MAAPWDCYNVISEKRMSDEIVLNSQAGDQAARAQLYEKYTPMIRKAATQHVSAGSPREDLEQEGALALFEALKEYNPSQGRFLPRAATFIRRAMLWYARAGERWFKRLADEPLDKIAVNSEDKDSTPAPSLDMLTDSERAAVVRYYGLQGYEPMTHEEIAPTLGVTRQRITQLLRSAIRKLRYAAPPD